MTGRLSYLDDAVQFAHGDLHENELTEQHADALVDLAREIRECVRDRKPAYSLSPVTRRCVDVSRIFAAERRRMQLLGVR